MLMVGLLDFRGNCITAGDKQSQTGTRDEDFRGRKTSRLAVHSGTVVAVDHSWIYLFCYVWSDSNIPEEPLCLTAAPANALLCLYL